MPLPFLPLILTPIVFAIAKRSADDAQKQADTAAGDTTPETGAVPPAATEDTPVVVVPVSASTEAEGQGAELAVDADPLTYWQPTENRGWLAISLPETREVHRITISEVNGSHVQLYAVEYQLTEDGPWRTLFAGDTLGPEKAEAVPPTLARTLRLQILASDAPPAIATFRVE